jgi:uncharacterized protein YukE
MDWLYEGGIMTRIGAGIEELASLKARFETEQQTIEGLKSGIDGQLGSVYWEGPAAERFRDSWSGDYRPALDRLFASLGEAAAEIENRRQRLEAAGS